MRLSMRPSGYVGRSAILTALATAVGCSGGPAPSAPPVSSPSPSIAPESRSLPSASPPSSPAVVFDCSPDPAATTDWSGRYQASEAYGGGEGPFHVMDYRVDVFRDARGVWRAFVAANGHLTNKRLAACGEPAGQTLAIRTRRARIDDMNAAEPADEGETLFSVERAGRRLVLRFPSDGSWLGGKPTLPASRKRIPEWAGRYSYDSCAAQPTSTGECWRYLVEVSLEEEGWVAHVSADGPGTTERWRVVGEEWNSLTDARLDLVFASYSPGDAHSGAGHQPADDVASLVRQPDGSNSILFEKLPAPAGMKQAGLKVVRPSAGPGTSTPKPAR